MANNQWPGFSMCGVPKLLWVVLGATLHHFFDRIENFGLEPLEVQVIGPFDLAIELGMRHRGVVDVDAALMAVVPEL